MADPERRTQALGGIRVLVTALRAALRIGIIAEEELGDPKRRFYRATTDPGTVKVRVDGRDYPGIARMRVDAPCGSLKMYDPKDTTKGDAYGPAVRSMDISEE